MNSLARKYWRIFVLFFLGLVFSSIVSADFSSTSYVLENPINIISGGQSTSSSFQYISTNAQTAQGQSTSVSFAQNAGFLYFPTATSPVLSATPGNTQVILNWTSATGILANITSLQTGISTVSGGPYTYVDRGNVLTYTYTGLTNSTPYYFKVRSYAAGLLLSESAQVSATPVGAGGGGGGGGGGGSGGKTTTGDGAVFFSGRAYPLSRVSILKDGQLVLTTIAGPDSNFSATLDDLSSGDYTFSVYGEDSEGRRSSPFTFPIFITSGVTTNITGIFIAPTIAVDKKEVKKGDNIAIFGQSSPSADIVLSVNSPQEFFVNAPSDADGIYLHNFDTSVLELGAHSTKSKALKSGEISSFSETVAFKVGDKNVFIDPTIKSTKCDLNDDNRCNLIDFSIAAFWYKKVLSSSFIQKEIDHLNGDGKIDLIDFSIMAFYWTG